MNLAEAVPGDLAELVGLAIAAAHQVEKRVVRQCADRHFHGFGHECIRLAAVLDHSIAADRAVTGRRGEAPADVAEQVTIGLGRHLWHRHDRRRLADVAVTLGMDIEQAHHLGRLRACHRDFVAISDQHQSAFQKYDPTLFMPREQEIAPK